MIIVCAQDPAIQAVAMNPGSGASAWGNVYILGGTQRSASSQFGGALRLLERYEPLCLSAHGNDTEIGDGDEVARPWTWTTTDVAALLNTYAPHNYAGPILISACANTVANFSAGLALALDGAAQYMNGIWIYGYNIAVATNTTFPNPNGLSMNVELQGSRVNF
jgi:hypothetical protein